MTSTTATTADQSTKRFSDFDLDPALVAALAEIGIEAPFPIQELALPLALTGADIIGQARTGTGKTLAFGLPMLQRSDPDRPVTQGLVIVPTRELCLQVRGDLAQAGSRTDVRVTAAYGGKAIEPQIRELETGAHIVVGTPGRLLDLLRRGVLDLSQVSTLVLDEADEMLDLGFLPDVEQLIEATATERQTLLFSATMPAAVVGLARRYMRQPTFLRADVEEVRIAPRTRQHFFSCHRMDKPAVLARILQDPTRGLCVVFTRTKRMADVLANELRDRGIDAAPIHSDLRQESRERALDRFRRGKIDVLVATEVAARGLDIDDVTHVVNYDCPDDEKMYLHRIGRTGRAGAAGVAVTLAVWNELARLEMIKRALEIDEPTHEVFSTSEILDELFDLPPRGGRAPVAAEAGDDDDEDQAEASQEEARTPTGAGATGRPRRRRRRGRGDDRGQADRRKPAAATKRDAAPEEEQQKADEGQDRAVRRRVRTRTTRTTQQAGATSPRASGTGRRASERGTTRPEQATDTADQPQTRERRDQPKGGGSRTRRSKDRRGDQRSDAQRRGQRAPKAAPMDTATARGDGKPALRRSMSITYLP